ncbi:MAG: hypothetical protein WAM28_09135 [Chlamydiales bacterium]
MLEELVPLAPIHFFSIQADCYYAKEKKLTQKHVLPDLSQFHGRASSIEVALGWHETGLVATLFTKEPLDHCFFPDYQSGDSLEFFFDTRDVKTGHYLTRFCHHFYFLPHPVETNGDTVQSGEVTRFRSEDRHELCDPSHLAVDLGRKQKMHIFIPAECLYGYDPSQFDRLGFTYRLNRYQEEKEYFSANDEDFNIEQHPSFWASLKLEK